MLLFVDYMLFFVSEIICQIEKNVNCILKYMQPHHFIYFKTFPHR